MGRSPVFDKGLRRGPWTPEEDRKLVAYIEEHGHGSWRALPVKAGLQRCGKSSRLRWTNYLSPDIKRGKFTLQEEQTIMQLHALLGNRWSAIATHLPKRTDNEIKNYWNTHLKKRLTKMGIDPITHKSRIALTTSLSHMTQWENARLEAEARLVRESKLVLNSYKRIHHHGSAPLINTLPVQPFSWPQPTCFDVLKAWQGIVSCKPFDLRGQQPPFSTLNFSKQTLPPPSINLIDDTELSYAKEINVKDCTNNWEISKDPVDIPRGSKDKEMLNVLKFNDIVIQDDYLMETLTSHLMNNENPDVLFEDDDRWSQILDKLEHNSSFPYVF